MLAEFGAWWAQQMLDLLPRRLAHPDAGAAEGLVLHANPDGGGGYAGVALGLRRKHKTAELGRFTLDEAGQAAARQAMETARRRAGSAAGRVILRLDGPVLLERDVALPMAAERDIERVLFYDMDRLTPFSAAEVFWTWTLLRRDRAQAKLHTRISLIPKAGLESLLATLGAMRMQPTMLEVALPGRGARLIALSHEGAGRRRWQLRAMTAGIAACGVLAVAALALPFLRQSWALDAVEARIEALKPRVAQAEALRRRIATEATGADALASARARTGNALQVLAALTDILPDDTSLTSFTLRQRQLTMEGRSAAAVKLIAGLSADPVVRNPTFAAPVVRSEDGADIFSIRAELGP